MTNYTTQVGLSNAFVLSILEDQQGRLWFGTADGQVYTFNGQRFERQF